MTTQFQLVEYDDVLRRLRIGAEADESDIQAMIYQASAIVMKHLKLTSLPDAWLQTNGSPSLFDVPDDIQTATMLVIGNLEKYRDGEKDPLTAGVKSLLNGHRDPSLA